MEGEGSTSTAENIRELLHFGLLQGNRAFTVWSHPGWRDAPLLRLCKLAIINGDASLNMSLQLSRRWRFEGSFTHEDAHASTKQVTKKGSKVLQKRS